MTCVTREFELLSHDTEKKYVDIFHIFVCKWEFSKTDVIPGHTPVLHETINWAFTLNTESYKFLGDIEKFQSD